MVEWFIYENTVDNKARFLLGEKWEKILICIWVNPSTATPEKLDNTLKTVKRFSKDCWYDWWLMLNLYPQRATNPDDMDTTINKEYHDMNLQHIKNITQKYNCDVWAAWGTLIEKRKYLKRCLEEIYAVSNFNDTNWYTIWKKSKKWHPHHPLYLNKSLRLEVFDIQNYITNSLSL